MILAGPILENVKNAAASARRLRDHPVYKDTLTYWSELLQEARNARKALAGAQLYALDAAIISLEAELAQRAR